VFAPPGAQIRPPSLNAFLWHAKLMHNIAVHLQDFVIYECSQIIESYSSSTDLLDFKRITFAVKDWRVPCLEIIGHENRNTVTKRRGSARQNRREKPESRPQPKGRPPAKMAVAEHSRPN
jgi:hypothetical protein